MTRSLLVTSGYITNPLSVRLLVFFNLYLIYIQFSTVHDVDVPRLTGLTLENGKVDCTFPAAKVASTLYRINRYLHCRSLQDRISGQNRIGGTQIFGNDLVQRSDDNVYFIQLSGLRRYPRIFFVDNINDFLTNRILMHGDFVVLICVHGRFNYHLITIYLAWGLPIEIVDQ